MNDLEDLFARYIDHVGQCCGRIFLREIVPDRDGKSVEDQSSVRFSAEELATLENLAERAWRKPRKVTE